MALYRRGKEVEAGKKIRKRNEREDLTV